MKIISNWKKGVLWFLFHYNSMIDSILFYYSLTTYNYKFTVKNHIACTNLRLIFYKI